MVSSNTISHGNFAYIAPIRLLCTGHGNRCWKAWVLLSAVIVFHLGKTQSMQLAFFICKMAIMTYISVKCFYIYEHKVPFRNTKYSYSFVIFLFALVELCET